MTAPLPVAASATARATRRRPPSDSGRSGHGDFLPLLRLVRISFELLRFVLGWAAERLHLARSRSPERLRSTLARLGPTFIKFGQALSLRREMMPEAYIAALQSQQDHIAPFAAADALHEIERGLGRSLRDVFAHIDRKPLAAASVAQVHTARLHDGREVIVKVRRIGIRTMVDRDMRALLMVMRLAMVLIPRLRHYQPLRLIDEI